MTTSEETLKLARDFRYENKLNAEEAIDLRSLLLKLNVITLFTPLSAGFCGMAIKAGNNRFMLINSSHPLGKQNFTICHELYHLYKQKDFTSMVCVTGMFDRQNKIEYTADCFASDLLIPEYGIYDLIPTSETKVKNNITIESLLKVEHYFSCSRAALLHRLKNMKLIDSAFYDQHVVDVKKSAKMYGYSTKLYESTNEDFSIGNYGNLIKREFDNNKISESHYISLMRDIGLDVEEDINCI